MFFSPLHFHRTRINLHPQRMAHQPPSSPLNIFPLINSHALKALLSMENLPLSFKTSSLYLLCAALFFLLLPFLLKVLIYFSPLLSSTAICLLALHLFILSKEKSFRELLFVNGETGEGLVQVCEEANFSFYGDHIGAGCVLLKTGGRGEEENREEDGVIFAGMIVAGRSIDSFVERIAGYELDCLAEGLWNRYFGRFSKWNYIAKASNEPNIMLEL